MKKVCSLIFVFIVSSFFLGCGSNGTNNLNNKDYSNQIKTKGYLLDSALEGVSYFCDGQTRLTNSKGLFECVNTPVTFKIGNLTLGTITTFTKDSKVYPQDLLGLPRTNFTNSRLKLLTQFLQSLDDDGNISTTIKIDQNITDTFDVNQRFEDLNESNIKTLVSTSHKNFVREDSAMRHLANNIVAHRDGNSSEEELVTSDTTKPIITLNEASSIELIKGSTYTELGATAIDDQDGIVTVTTTGTVDVNVPGTYIITYTATDNAKNKAVCTRIVKINSNGTVQLGNLTNATVKIYEVEKDGSLTLKWNESVFSDNKFNLHTQDLDLDKFYLYKVSGEENSNKNNSDQKDTNSTKNKKILRAIAKGSDIVDMEELKITAISDILYEKVAKILKNDFNSTDFNSILNKKANLIIEDIDGDGDIDIQDILNYNPITNKDKLKLNKILDTLRQNKAMLSSLDSIFDFYNMSGEVFDVIFSNDGSKAYVADNDLVIVDISDPANLTKLGSYNTAEYTRSIPISSDGSKAYVADDDNGLVIVDILDPTNPTKLGSYNTAGYVRNITLSSDDLKAYISDDNGLTIVDISDPTNPTKLGSYDMTGVIYDIIIASDGSKAYIADDNGLTIVDISDPTNPTKLGFYNMERYAYSITLSNDDLKVYIADEDNNLVIVDISDPANPIKLDSSNVWEKAYGVIHSNDYSNVYIADNNNGLIVVDISDPANPIKLGFYNIRGYARSISLSSDGSKAYIADEDNSLIIVDISDPANPTKLGSYNSAITDETSNLPKAVVKGMTSVSNNMVNGMTSVANNMVDHGVANDMVKGMTSVANNMVDGMTNVANNMLKGMIKIGYDYAPKFFTLISKLSDDIGKMSDRILITEDKIVDVSKQLQNTDSMKNMNPMSIMSSMMSMMNQMMNMSGGNTMGSNKDMNPMNIMSSMMSIPINMMNQMMNMSDNNTTSSNKDMNPMNIMSSMMSIPTNMMNQMMNISDNNTTSSNKDMKNMNPMNFMMNMATNMMNQMINIPTKMIETMSNMPESMVKAGVVEGMTSVSNNMVDGMTSVANNMVEHEVANDMVKGMTNVANNMANGMTDVANNMTNEMTKIGYDYANQFFTLTSKLADDIGKMADRILITEDTIVDVSKQLQIASNSATTSSYENQTN